MKFSHLFSWAHVISNFKPALKQVKQGQTILDLMCRAIQEFHGQSYRAYMSQIKNMLKGK